MKFTLHSFRCLAATLAVAGVLRETTAQETLTIEYTTRVNSWSEPVRLFVEVEKDIRTLANYSGDIPASHFGMMTTLILPEGLTNLKSLSCVGLSRLFHIVLPKGMTSLEFLLIGNSSLSNFVLPEGMTSLTNISIYDNSLTNFVLPEDMTSLNHLHLGRSTHLTNIVFSNSMPNLKTLRLNNNSRLTNLILSEDMPNLEALNLRDNWLTNLVLPEGLSSLTDITIQDRSLTNLVLPEGLSNLEELNLGPAYVEFLLRVPSGMNIDNLHITRGRTKQRGGWWIENGELQNPPFRIEFYGASPPSPPDEPSLPRLTYRRLANGLELSWEGGTLQSAPTITGHWQDVGSSGGAFKLFSSSPAEFFRVKP